MSIADYSLTIFVTLNVARALAYWPQIMCIYRDPGGASVVSLSTWTVFTAAHVATVLFALAGIGNLIVAAVFGANAIGCASIVLLTMYKRYHHRLPIWTNISRDCGLDQTSIQLSANASSLQRHSERTDPESTPCLQSLTAASRPADGTAGIPFREA